MKQCRTCEQTLDKSQFSLHKGYKDGLTTQCKPCRADYERERRSKKGIQVLRPRREIVTEDLELIEQSLRKCRDCDEVKKLSKFSDNSRDKRAGKNTYCKQCIQSRTNKWREDNQDKVEQYRKENSEEIALYRKRYREEHKKDIREFQRKWYEENREYKLQKNREWLDNNPEYIARKRARRRAVVREGEVDLETLQEQDVECYICEDVIDYTARWPDPQSPTVDHVKSISGGGAHEQSNLAYVHKVCNEQKGARDYSIRRRNWLNELR